MNEGTTVDWLVKDLKVDVKRGMLQHHQITEKRIAEYAQNKYGVKLTKRQIEDVMFEYRESMDESMNEGGDRYNVVDNHGRVVKIDLAKDFQSFSFVFLIIGFFNIFGTIGMGFLASKYSKKILLSILYFSRGIILILFLLLVLYFFVYLLFFRRFIRIVHSQVSIYKSTIIITFII